jgi:hypothetical protein
LDTVKDVLVVPEALALLELVVELGLMLSREPLDTVKDVLVVPEPPGLPGLSLPVLVVLVKFTELMASRAVPQAPLEGSEVPAELKARTT